MKFKLNVLVTGMIITLVGASYVKSTSGITQQPIRAKSQSRLKQWVQEAKLKGETRLEIHGRIFNKARFTNLEDALHAFDLVKVEPISQKSVIEEGDVINTWYKFRIIETLSQAKVIYDFSFMPPPPEMLPLQTNEILVSVGGGVVTVDGVEVSSGEPGEPGIRAFDENQKYLLLLCVDPVTKISTADLGSAGIFLVRDNDALMPFDVSKRHIYDALKTNSISGIKENLKHRH